jgi:phytoene dehydrogenase-like protein
MFDYAVVGSGVGGASMASLLNSKGYDVALFEKEPYLGGCSSSFQNGKFSYNTGATTFAGYQEGMLVKELFDEIGFEPELIKTDPSIIIKQNGKTTPRYQDFERFMQILQKNYPHKKNMEFWTLVYRLNQDFYKYKKHYYSNKNSFAKLISLFSFIPLGLKFQKYMRVSALKFIEEHFGDIDDEYLQFLESQILIVAQTRLDKTSFFTAAVALAYTFNDNYYAVGGFSRIFDGMCKDIEHVYRSTEILHIEKKEGCFELYSKQKVYKTKKLILNSTVYDSAILFDDKDTKNYYKKYERLNNYQSSFMLYMTIKSDKEFAHHYQLIQEKKYPYTVSNALFVSFSDKDDDILAPKGHYSITASIHTDLRIWHDAQRYRLQKKELKNILLDKILRELDIDEDEVVCSFAATPKTFQRYIRRSQLGGNEISMKNFLPYLPSNDTPIDDLYNVGDSVYAAQGWPGVMMGVRNLQRLLNV